MLIVDNVELSMAARELVGAAESSSSSTDKAFESCEVLSARASTASIEGEVCVGGVEAE